VLRHHPAGLGVGLAAPVEFLPLEPEAVTPRRRFHRHDAFRHHLLADAVAGDHRYPIILCHPLLTRAGTPGSYLSKLKISPPIFHPVPLRRQITMYFPATSCGGLALVFAVAMPIS